MGSDSLAAMSAKEDAKYVRESPTALEDATETIDGKASEVIRVRTANGITLSTLQVVGANNTEATAALLPRFGIYGLWGSMQTAARKWKLFRGGIEALGLSGRDPEAVLNADWERTKAKFDAGLYALAS